MEDNSILGTILWKYKVFPVTMLIFGMLFVKLAILSVLVREMDMVFLSLLVGLMALIVAVMYW